MAKATLRVLAAATLATTTTTVTAFVPPSLVVARQMDTLKRSSPSFFQNGNEEKESEIPFPQSLPPLQQAPILPRVSIDKTTPSSTGSTTTEYSNDNVNDPSKLILPSLPVAAPAVVSATEKTKSPSLLEDALGLTQRWGKAFQKWKRRPGVKFRLRLGVITTAALAISSFLLPRVSNHHIRLIPLLKKWISHRGFQGIAALGRTVAYIWALLVGYPRVLDRRAKERARQTKEDALERRRQQLHRLAGEVARLRQERTSLDAEIRSFRREIISLKAYAASSNKQQQQPQSPADDGNQEVSVNNDSGEEIQKAINTEMGHLLQLRSDTQAALDAARQTWAEYRSKSPPEIWDDTLMPY